MPEYVARLRRHIGHDLLWLPGVTAVVRRGRGPSVKVLRVRRSDNGQWTPRTGIVDPAEEPAAAAAREAHEETGVVIAVDRLALVGVTEEVAYSNGDRSVYLDLTFACTWVSGEARVADEESTEVRWCRSQDLAMLLPAVSVAMRERIRAARADESAAGFSTGGRAAATPCDQGQGPRSDQNRR